MTGYVKGSFTGVANGTQVDNADAVDLVVSGTFVGTIQLQMAMANAAGADVWTPVSAGLTAPGVITQTVAGKRKFRAACSAYTSGTIDYELSAAGRTTHRGAT